MHVDEPRRDDQIGGINHPLRIARGASEGDNSISFGGHIAVEPRVARAIDNFTAADDEVVFRPGGVNPSDAEQNEGATQ